MDDACFGFRVVRFPSMGQLYRLIRRADVIHISGPAILPMAIGYLLRKPVVVEHDGYQAVCPVGNYLHLPDRSLCPGHFQNGNYLECYRCQSVEMSHARSIRNLLLMFPRRWLLKRVAVNVGASDHTGRRVALPRTQTIYHGIEDPLAATPARAGASSPVQFAYLGRLIPEKGVDLLLRAAAKFGAQMFTSALKLSAMARTANSGISRPISPSTASGVSRLSQRRGYQDA